ncbi:Hypothetical protein CINCED_3A017296 [Cinara cedri]|uniref:DNA-directed DNA polymerase n=1 Tax=Cinara cedri TaxID=506608 RepID=A0A5E4NSX3_9HEMI|nr:Hypothetical protein CINCED_3A017296 [Cinara cedri]
MDTYGVDPNYYYTAPGMAFDCALIITKVEVELLSDYNKVLMMEAGIRGGLTQAVKRYSKANNSKVPGYDSSKPESTIAYLYATNLYGWAMMQCLPNNGFEWYDKDLSTENILRLLDGMDDISPVGLILEVDVTYITLEIILFWMPSKVLPNTSIANVRLTLFFNSISIYPTIVTVIESKPLDKNSLSFGTDHFFD